MQKTNLPWNSKQIHSMFMNGCLTFDNVIQRGFVWDKRRSSLLIDTMLRDMIVPPIYVIKTGEIVKTKKGDVSVYDVIDGKQRCLTVSKFRNNEFALSGLEFEVPLSTGETVDVNGKTFDELPDELKEVFDRFSFSISMIIDASADEVTEVMARLNNGKALSTVENTRIKAKDLSGIQSFARLDFFKNNLTEKAVNGYQNEDIIVKMCMLLDNMDKNDISLDNRDVRAMFETLQIRGDARREGELEAVITAMSDITNTMIEHKKKTIAKRFVKKINLLSSVRTIKRFLDNGSSLDHMAGFFETFFDNNPSMNEDYNEACKGGTNHASNVGKRENAIRSEFDWWNGNAPVENSAEETVA